MIIIRRVGLRGSRSIRDSLRDPHVPNGNFWYTLLKRRSMLCNPICCLQNRCFRSCLRVKDAYGDHFVIASLKGIVRDES